MLKTILRTALWSLGRNKLRSFLTMLGIIIGVAAVVGMVSLGQGAMSAVDEQISAMGLNLLTILPGSKTLGGFRTGAGGVITLVPADAAAIARECASAALVSPMVRSGVQAIYKDRNASTSMQGASPQFLGIRQWEMSDGAFFDDDQVRLGVKVCVLGQTVATELFGDEDPLGKVIRLKHIPFMVVGLLAVKGQNSQGQDQDDTVIVPWTTGMRRLMGIRWLSQIIVSARSAALMTAATGEISRLLRRRHRLKPTDDDDFMVQNQTDIAKTQEETMLLMLTLVVVVALVALLVGGIGVMNIMLVSVLERTREIGLRMAVGARPVHVMLQFLGEAVVLTSLGGLIGIGMGAGVSLAVPQFLGWPTKLTLLPIAGSFAFSSAVGIFFGWYPAVRASRMDPIDALRYE